MGEQALRTRSKGFQLWSGKEVALFGVVAIINLSACTQKIVHSDHRAHIEARGIVLCGDEPCKEASIALRTGEPPEFLDWRDHEMFSTVSDKDGSFKISAPDVFWSLKYPSRTKRPQSKFYLIASSDQCGLAAITFGLNEMTYDSESDSFILTAAHLRLNCDTNQTR